MKYWIKLNEVSTNYYGAIIDYVSTHQASWFYSYDCLKKLWPNILVFSKCKYIDWISKQIMKRRLGSGWKSLPYLFCCPSNWEIGDAKLSWLKHEEKRN